MDEFTRRRLLHNEQLFRAINDEVQHSHPAPNGQKIGFICECSDRGCTETVELTVDEYRSLRRCEDRFVVLPGHVVRELERVVETHPDYEIVEKDEEAAA
jgi:hypothetical protein